jgi:hypothetical protein
MKTLKMAIVHIGIIQSVLFANTIKIPDLYGTGVDNLGIPLPVNSLDSHYVLTGPSTPAYVTLQAGTPRLDKTWWPLDNSAPWIGPQLDSNQDAPSGDYAYTLSFNLTGFDLEDVTISGQWSSDNGSSIYLNGVQTGFTSNDFSKIFNFSLDSGFVSGVNTLEFRVNNVSGPSGLLVQNLYPMITVSGMCNPWLAGMPDGTTAFNNDTAPEQSPKLLPRTVNDIKSIQFDVSGYTYYMPGDGGGPDGMTYIETHVPGSEHGISSLTAPLCSLIGVFLDDNLPSDFSAPASLDFSTEVSRNFTEINPLLRQVFFIGNGRTDSDVVQTFNVPSGATRLFLGIMDGSGWWNNEGSFEVKYTLIHKKLDIIFPDGGEDLVAGSTQSILWKTSSLYSTSNVKIEYSDSEGLSWQVIEPNIPNLGEYSWTLPILTSSKCLVRISDASNPGIYDISEEVFRIFRCINPLGDFNNDCIVNLVDFALFAANWLTSGDLDSELISYWGFEEGNGSIAHDSTDGNNGTINGASWSTGISGTGLSFDGINDYVEVPNSTNLNPTGGITIAAWINAEFTQTTPWSPVVTHSHWDTGTTTQGYALEFDISNTGIRFYIDGPNDEGAISNVVAVPRNVWTFVVGVYDGENVNLYVNAEPSTPKPCSTTEWQSTAPLYIGGSVAEPDRSFSGLIDNVRIYDRALSPAEIEYLYQNP